MATSTNTDRAAVAEHTDERDAATRRPPADLMGSFPPSAPLMGDFPPSAPLMGTFPPSAPLMGTFPPRRPLLASAPTKDKGENRNGR